MRSPQGKMMIAVTILLTFGLSGYSGICLSLGRPTAGGQVRSNHMRMRGHSFSMGKSSSSSSEYASLNRGSGGGGGGRRHLHLYGVEVPVYKFRGEDAQLECKYDPGNDPLYSVKWYKDDNEFYRYLFRKQTPKQIFPIPGIVVDVHRSNERRVLLKELTFNSTGIYRCEVSADSPHFRTYDNHSVMVVVELPEQGPTINGGRSHYRVGETASLNCTSSRSKPAAKLTWFINDIPVKSSQLVQYYPWKHDDGLESRRLGLSFTVDKSHFLTGELTLKCQAIVAAIYTAIEEEDATVFEGEPFILEQREHLIHVRSESTTLEPSYAVLLVFIILMREQAIT